MKNNIDLLGIGIRPDMGSAGTKIKDLETYLCIAKKTISSYANSIRPGLAGEMMKNEDAIANIAHSIMVADTRYNGTTGTLHGYRKYIICNAIRSYVKRSKDLNNKSCLSLNMTSSPSGGLSYSETLEDRKAKQPYEKMEKEELSDKLSVLLNQPTITTKERSFIRAFYLKGQTLGSIGEENGVTKQAVHQLIQRGLNKLRGKATKDDFFRGIINEDS